MQNVRLFGTVSGPVLIRPRRLHGSIAHDLAVEIVSGRLGPGQVLPSEEELSAKLSVSRTAYREATKILAAKGLIESRPRTGTRVAPRAAWNLLDPDVLAWHFEAEPSPSFITALYELRRILEPNAAALAAARRTDDDVTVLQEALLAMTSAPSESAEAQDADVRFHAAILNAAGNEAVRALSSAVAATIAWSVRVKASGLPSALKEAEPRHRAVLDAIKRRDPEGARHALTALVDAALADTLRALQRMESPKPRA